MSPHCKDMIHTSSLANLEVAEVSVHAAFEIQTKVHMQKEEFACLANRSGQTIVCSKPLYADQVCDRKDKGERAVFRSYDALGLKHYVK